MNDAAPIRSRAIEEGSGEIPLWSVPVVLLVLYICLFSGLGALGLVGPDEPRYAAIARAMAETHDWVTPRLWGTPWFEKPILYYWTAGTAMRIFGASEFAARLPSAMAALLAVVAVAWTALRSYGTATAWYVLLMLPTSVAMIGFARAASPDMLFAGLLTAAMAVAVEILQTSRPGHFSRVAFGFFLGAAVLAKGPAAVILAGGATLLWAAVARQWRAPLRFLHPLIILVFCATALPWYVLCAMRNPDFLRVFIWQHNFERYLTPVFQHPQPFWFFGPIIVLGSLPWALFLAPAVVDAVMRLRSGGFARSPTAFLACWTIFPILFFSLSHSKLPGYVLPAVPPLFLLLSRSVTRLVQANSKSALRLVGWTGAFFLPTAIIGGAVGAISEPKYLVEYLPAALAAAIGGAAIIWLAMTKRAKAALTALVFLIAILVEVANVAIAPRLDAQISARPLASELLRLDPTGEDVAVSGIPQAWRYGLNFYLHRELPEWTPESSDPKWVFGGVLFFDLQGRYQTQFDELSYKNGLRVSLFRRRYPR